MKCSIVTCLHQLCFPHLIVSVLRKSYLQELLKQQQMTLPDEWGTLRPEVLTPAQFVELTKLIFGEGETPPGVSVWRGKLDDAARLGAL